MKAYNIKDINKGGIADSMYQGGANSQYKLVGLDIHNDGGIIRSNYALKKGSPDEGGGVVSELVTVIITATNGNTYHFSGESGKIWQESAGSWSLIDTSTARSGEVKCLGAIEYEGYLYWATQNYLHRIAIKDVGSWSTNVQRNWKALHIDHDKYGFNDGEIYTLGTSISEAATHKQMVTFYETIQTGIDVNIVTKGTGNWTVTLHNEANTSIASKTITNANLSTGYNLFTWDSPININRGEEYHVHITSTVADGTVATAITEDLGIADLEFYSQGDNEYHQMVEQNLVMYIADRQYVHQVDVDTQSYEHIYNAWALDIPVRYRIKCLGVDGTDLLIGTLSRTGENQCRFIKWNTWGESFQTNDPVPESAIHAFITGDNFVLAIAGLGNNIYIHRNGRLERFKTLQGDYNNSSYNKIYPEAVANFNGYALLGISNGAGNPVEQGVYSYGSKRANYPFVLNLEYIISKRVSGDFVLSNVTIGAIAAKAGQLYVSWKHGSDTGVDVIDYTSRLSGAYLISRLYHDSRLYEDNWKLLTLIYRTLPTNTDIKAYYSLDHGNTWIEWNDLTNSIIHNYIQSKETVRSNRIMIKVELICSGVYSPEVEEIYLIV